MRVVETHEGIGGRGLQRDDVVPANAASLGEAAVLPTPGAPPALPVLPVLPAPAVLRALGALVVLTALPALEQVENLCFTPTARALWFSQFHKRRQRRGRLCICDTRDGACWSGLSRRGSRWCAQPRKLG